MGDEISPRDNVQDGTRLSDTHRVCVVLGPPEWRERGACPDAAPVALLELDLPAFQVGANTTFLAVASCHGTAAVCHVGERWEIGHRIAEVDVETMAPGIVTLTETEQLPAATQASLRRLAPLFLVVHETSAVYAATAEEDAGVVFLRSWGPPGPTAVDGQSSIAPIVDAHRRHLQELNNHNNSHHALRKWASSDEIEYKLDLEPTADIWIATQQLLLAARRNELPGFAPYLRLPFTRWEFDNHLFEIVGTEGPEGYVSFIPEGSGCIVKEKRFRRDQLRRQERVRMNVAVEPPFERYLEQHFPGDQFIAHQPFRRVRFDVDVESFETGNHFVISLDRCTLSGNDSTLQQCEIEYVDSRTIGEPRLVMEELERLVQLVEQRLDAIKIPFTRSFRSKLTFLRDVEAGRATRPRLDVGKER